MASLRFKRLRRDNGHHSREHVQITGGLPPDRVVPSEVLPHDRAVPKNTIS